MPKTSNILSFISDIYNTLHTSTLHFLLHGPSQNPVARKLKVNNGTYLKKNGTFAPELFVLFNSAQNINLRMLSIGLYHIFLLTTNSHILWKNSLNNLFLFHLTRLHINGQPHITVISNLRQIGLSPSIFLF